METSDSPLTAGFHIAENVTRTVLPNGITLLVKENHTAPVVSLLVSVQVGYFNEPDSLGGISHVIEHMLFKGTPRRPEKEQIAREIRELGGVINAGTYYEETYYYVLVPSLHVERAMEIQADAFQNPLFDGDELTKEIEVIVQESLQKRDSPSAMLIESFYALAFDKHRLQRWRIGEPAVLRALTQQDLGEFYNANYIPENITLVIVGDIDTENAKELASRFWSRMERGVSRREVSPPEPPPTDFRYRRLTGDTQQRLLLMGFPAPPILHPDAAPLMVLSALLSDGRSARLFRRLKEEQRLVNSAWASYEGFEQMGLFTLGAESIADDPLPVEKALWAEVRRIQQELVAADDLERIKTRVESRRLFAQEEVMSVARTLATYENLGDYRLTDAMLERLHAVTAQDVRRVAEAYLKLPRGALLEYLPASADLPPEQPGRDVEMALYDAEDAVDAQYPTPLLHSIVAAPPAARPDTFSARHIHVSPRAETAPAKVLALPAGGTLYYKLRRDLPIVSISALFRGGRLNETRADGGLTNLMLKSAIKGTRRYSAEEIANRVEGLGSGIGMSLSPDFFGYGIKLRKDVLQEGFGIFAEVMAHPTFPAEEVEREKQSIYAEIRRQQDNNFSLAYDLFSGACYGDDHPYGLPASGIAEAVAAFTPDDLLAWHRRHVVAENFTAGIVGDLSEEEALALFADLLAHGSGQWPREPLPRPAPTAAPGPSGPCVERVLQRPKQQTAAVMGFPGASVSNEDRYALDVLAEITSGMSGRFFRSVRGDNALAYQVSSFHRARLEFGNFITYTSTAPENEQRARDLILAECDLLARETVTPAELAAAKAALLGEHVIGTQTFGAQAGELAAVAVYNLPPDEPQRYLRRIEAVTAEAVRDVARRYLQTDRCWLGLVRGGAEGVNIG